MSGFVPVDAALKVVGVGSVGTRCLIVLLVAAYLAHGTPAEMAEADKQARISYTVYDEARCRDVRRRWYIRRRKRSWTRCWQRNTASLNRV